MTINAALLPKKEVLLRQLEELIRKKSDNHVDPEFLAFVRLYLANFPLSQWGGSQLSDVYGFCRGLWYTMHYDPSSLPLVQVFTPNLAEHGWICGRTVLVVLQRDMPFLVDSLRIELNCRKIHVHVIKSLVLYVKRGVNGPENIIKAGRDAAVDNTTHTKEALIYVEVNLLSDNGAYQQLETAIHGVLADVANAIQDYQPILQKLNATMDGLKTTHPHETEAIAFLEWLPRSHFTFLGYRVFEFASEAGLSTSAATTQVNDNFLPPFHEPGALVETPSTAEYAENQNTVPTALKECGEVRLGVFNKLCDDEEIQEQSDFSQGRVQFYHSDDLISISKAGSRSTVHRGVYPDYVVVKRFDADGNVTGEIRFLGLFTYSVYALSPTHIPLIRGKVDRIVAQAGYEPESHDGKNLQRVIENFPKDELFQADETTLFQNVMTIAEISERRVVKLIMRRDPFERFVNCMAYVPRDMYTTEVRWKIEALLGDALNTREFDSTTIFSESNLVRAQVNFRINRRFVPNFDPEELEAGIVEIARDWDEQLRRALMESLGETGGISHYHLYRHAFSPAYQAAFDARAVIDDIDMLEQLNGEHEIAMRLYQPMGMANDCMRFKIMRQNSSMVLSDIVPILENLGLRVLSENPYTIKRSEDGHVWLQDFQLKFALPGSIEISTVKDTFEAAFAAVWYGKTDSDAFNRLVLGARLTWREVALFRAYAAYMKQVGFTSTQRFIADTLVNHQEICRNVLALFKASFDPRLNKNGRFDHGRAERLTQKITDKLDKVENLNEDKVLRRYLELIDGTLRTNFFQKSVVNESDVYDEKTAQPKPYLSFKFSPRTIPNIPRPCPEFEIFVFSARVEGVHLRGGKVARGGLRWSDRIQDYRTEILGLVKAQQVKNAVIVPSGAKGGFVAKQLPYEASRDEQYHEAVVCYRIFIQGLLDLTDNIIGGEVQAPKPPIRSEDEEASHDVDIPLLNDVPEEEDAHILHRRHLICKDMADPYLVVAADKGTASFSDIANEISLDYGHWLGDAFASGGSQGYDHKGMGITAKGAWVAVQRHFREQGVDIQAEDFTVIGIGDMGGDVFGNGMLLSEHICLVAAFNHQHIFVDPLPNAPLTFTERCRLFNLPKSTWEDFDKTIISAGGGIFSRKAKSIAITAQMKKTFDISEDNLAPSELISALMKAPVDLIWNGGIGTYVKASWENHADVGDKANDSLRVNGKDLRCRVVGEGGNLGMTQLGRVEFALKGGACNTDFIDNAAGVDCSDHEVNIKIILDELVKNGDLTAKQRNQLLVDMTDNVSERVLQNNYRQTQAISLAALQALKQTNEYRRFIMDMESAEHLDRKLEFLPSDEDILERQNRGVSLTRPELSVLLSYSKVVLKEALSQTNIADDPYLACALLTAFPNKLCDMFEARVLAHPLRKEIVATQVANDMINNLGITAAHRLIATTGVSLEEIVSAYVISRDVFELESFHHYLRSLDNKKPAQLQMELMMNLVRRVRRGTRWFIRNRRGDEPLEPMIKVFREGLKQVHAVASEVIQGASREEWSRNHRKMEEHNIPQVWALKLAMPDALFSGLGLVQVAIEQDVEIAKCTETFFCLLERLELQGFAELLSRVSVDSNWQALAREAYIEDLEIQIRQLVALLVDQEKQDKAHTFSAESVDKSPSPLMERASGLAQGDEEVSSLSPIATQIEAWLDVNVRAVQRWLRVVKQIQETQATDYAMFAVALRELTDLVHSTKLNQP